MESTKSFCCGMTGFWHPLPRGVPVIITTAHSPLARSASKGFAFNNSLILTTSWVRSTIIPNYKREHLGTERHCSVPKVIWNVNPGSLGGWWPHLSWVMSEFLGGLAGTPRHEYSRVDPPSSTFLQFLSSEKHPRNPLLVSSCLGTLQAQLSAFICSAGSSCILAMPDAGAEEGLPSHSPLPLPYCGKDGDYPPAAVLPMVCSIRIVAGHVDTQLSTMHPTLPASLALAVIVWLSSSQWDVSRNMARQLPRTSWRSGWHLLFASPPALLPSRCLDWWYESWSFILVGREPHPKDDRVSLVPQKISQCPAAGPAPNQLL